MIDDKTSTERSFLRRWSQRKLAAARETSAPVNAAAATPAPATQAPATTAALPPTSAAPAIASELPSLESLTFESDFSAFLQPSVDPALKRAALRKLFADPRFNVMDGLDVYIDDYNKFEPIPPEIVKQLAHARYLFDPPKTRVNAQGYVEDVPAEEAALAAPDAEPADAAGAQAPATSAAAEESRDDSVDGESDAAPDRRTTDPR